MPLRLALGVGGTVAGRRLGAQEGGGGPRPLQCIPAPQPHAVQPVRSNMADSVRPGKDPGTLHRWIRSALDKSRGCAPVYSPLPVANKRENKTHQRPNA